MEAPEKAGRAELGRAGRQGQGPVPSPSWPSSCQRPPLPTHPAPSPRVCAYSRSSGRALRGGVWAELAPRKGRGLALPTSQGGARRERAACPGISLLEAGGVREMPSSRFPFPPLFILTLVPINSPARRVGEDVPVGPRMSLQDSL